MTTLAGMNLSELVEALRDGQASAVEAVRTSLSAVESLQPSLHAFISFDADRALNLAGKIDDARARGADLGPLAGVPIAVKDNICTDFGATTCASRMLESFQSNYSAHVAERLENAGAIIVGKTNLDEFAMGSSTENSSFFTTLNPWDSKRVAGGTSGGSAAAVAARIVPGALGSDTGGSIRQPASLCGVVGLKPTYGRVSRYGLVAHGSSLDQIGPIARTAKDTALLLRIIAGHDSRDSTSASEPVPDYVQSLDCPIRGLRIGVSEEYFGSGLDPQVAAAVKAALALLEGHGATLIPVHLPHMEYGIASYYLVSTAEASSNLARFDGVHYGRRTARPTDIIDLYSASRGEFLGAEVKRRIMLGTFVLSSGYYDAYYLKALKVRTLIKLDFEQAFEKVDVIASPVAPTTAFRLGEKSEDPLAMYLADIYTVAANLAGIPAISVPCGFDAAGLPIGLQLMGTYFTEDRLLNAAHQYQQITSWHERTPSIGRHTVS